MPLEGFLKRGYDVVKNNNFNLFQISPKGINQNSRSLKVKFHVSKLIF